MKTTNKLEHCYSINLDGECAQMLETIAAIEQRKPRELLRLLLIPVLRSRWVELEKLEHPENNQAPTIARFKL